MSNGIVILDRKSPIKVKDYFKREKCKVIETIELDSLYPAISSHPDIQICKITDEILVAAPEVYDYYKNTLSSLKILKGESFLSGTYPYDIAYNVAVNGNIAFHLKKYTDPVICKVLQELDINLIDVKQGYSRCNTAFTNDGLITSDKSIYMAALNNGIDALLIENDNSIILENFPYGFIGGATGMISANTLAISGNICFHKNHDDILKFTRKHKTSIKCLYDGHISDIGGILYF